MIGIEGPAFSEDGRHADGYALADLLATRFGAVTIIDIGLGSPPLSMTPAGVHTIVIDLRPHLEVGRRHFSEDHGREWNAAPNGHLGLTDEIVSRAIVICCGVVERLADPSHVLSLLSRLSRRALATIVTTAEQGARHEGAATDIAAAPESNIAAFERLLGEHGLRPTFTGLMEDPTARCEKKIIISVFDHCLLEEGRYPPDHFRPLSLVTTYNDRDIAEEIIGKFLDDGMDVVVQDNWSSDGTYERLAALAAGRDDLRVERFPERGPSRYFDLRVICRMKEEVAAKHPGRWIIHHDSDEIRCSPWAGISFRGGLYIAERMGYTAVDFTVCEFRPVDDGLSAAAGLERHIRHFGYSRLPAHFEQTKAWRQGFARVDLASSGGHQAEFPGRKIFPYKFLLKHYPLRSPEQARRKIFGERRSRYAPEERAIGWHTHYDDFDVGDRFIWNPAELIDFEAPATRRTYLLESIAGIGIVRTQPAPARPCSDQGGAAVEEAERAGGLRENGGERGAAS